MGQGMSDRVKPKFYQRVGLGPQTATCELGSDQANTLNCNEKQPEIGHIQGLKAPFRG